MRISVCAAFLVCACGTSVEVVGVGPSSPPVMSGISYALPALTYDVSVTRELIGCGNGDSRPEFEVGVEIAPRYGPGEMFVLDPTRLSSWRKTSKADLSFYGDGVLKSVNAGVVDRSPEIAAAAVTAGFAIARLALGIPSVPIPGRPDLGGAAPEPRFVCPRDMLKDIAAYSGIERKLSSELGAATRKLEPLHQAALIGGLSESEKKTAADLIAAIADLKRRIGEAVAPLNALRADLTLRQSHEIAPTASAQQEPIALALDSEPVRRWTTKFFDPPVKAGTTASNELADRFNLVAVWNVLARPVVDDGLCQRAGAGPQCGILSIDQDNEGRIEGLAYRDPIRAHLRVCQTAIAAMCSSGASKPLAQSVDAAPQLGRLMLLPLRNGFGEDTELTAEFAPDGRLLKAKYDSRKASGERALQVVGSSLNQGEAFVASRAKAQANAREAETADFDGRIRAAKQQRDLLDAEAALGADRIAQSRWLEDLEREIKQLEAEKKVRELREALKHGKHG